MERQKHLRLDSDERLLLDTLRQYLRAGSETEAATMGLFVLGEQLLAFYMAEGKHPHRCLALLGVLGAAARIDEGTPRYMVDESIGRLLRWHAPTQEYIPIDPILGPWLKAREA